VYHVHGEEYSRSVSWCWQQYFQEFNALDMSEGIVRRADSCPGFRMDNWGLVQKNVLASSVFNLAQRCMVLLRLSSYDFMSALKAVASCASEDYKKRRVACPFSTEEIIEAGRQVAANMRKPDGPSCYYLVLLHTSNATQDSKAADIRETWEISGRLEALKGTYLHKKIELFINALSECMMHSTNKWLSVKELLASSYSPEEYSPDVVMRHIAGAIDCELWNHPLALAFFEEERRFESIEFKLFRKWLETKPDWSPYRLEWSIFNEGLKVAGQLDSLWYDLTNERFVLVDWKRCRNLLTDDKYVLASQSYGRKGKSLCANLYDAAWSHYFVQQTLYAFMLDSKYDISVQNMHLVQCYPTANESEFNESQLKFDADFAMLMAHDLSHWSCQ